MTRFAMVGGICASFLLGTALTALAQDEHRNEQRENERQSSVPQDRQANQQEPARPHEQARPDDRRNQEPDSGNRKNTTPRSEGQQPQEPQGGDRHMQDRETHESERSREGRSDNGQQQAGAKHEGKQRRIPGQEFKAHFGSQHHFAPGRLQQYEGRPGFAYSGYTFVIVQNWPEGWGYDDDDYYVDYIDGEYWLFNVLYPGVRVELIIVG